MGRRRAEVRKEQIAMRSGAIALPEVKVTDPIELLVIRARKLRQKGDRRRALVTLRDAANQDEWGARTWTLLGALLAEMGQRAQAADAFERARWLRARAGDKARALVTARLAVRVLEAA